MNSMRITVPKVGLVPWIIEASVVAVSTHFLLGLPWIWGFLLGSIIAAVSPAVVVPCLFRLREKGYGVAKVCIHPLPAPSSPPPTFKHTDSHLASEIAPTTCRSHLVALVAVSIESDSPPPRQSHTIPPDPTPTHESLASSNRPL
jgi:hypothetical protein